MKESVVSVKGKIIAITGTLGLLGRQYAEVLSREGANVVITDLDGRKCERLAINLNKKFNVDSIGLHMDITKKNTIISVIDKILSKYGRIDVLINNAAINNPSNDENFFYTPFEKVRLEDWNSMLNVNLTGTFLCCQLFGQQMCKQRKGSIINISSMYGIVAPDQRLYRHFGKNKQQQSFVKPVMYSVSKAGIIMLTKYLAAYWGNKNVRVNALVPGGVFNKHDKEFAKDYGSKTPLGRMANIDDFNGAILYLASDSSSYMTGSCLIVDGGWTIW